jgi:hypothetical protein
VVEISRNDQNPLGPSPEWDPPLRCWIGGRLGGGRRRGGGLAGWDCNSEVCALHHAVLCSLQETRRPVHYLLVSVLLCPPNCHHTDMLLPFPSSPVLPLAPPSPLLQASIPTNVPYPPCRLPLPISPGHPPSPPVNLKGLAAGDPSGRSEPAGPASCVTARVTNGGL